MNSSTFVKNHRPAGTMTIARRSIMAAALFAVVIGSANSHESGASAGQGMKPVASPSTPVFWERYREQLEEERH